jgi:predicted DNA-binding transcriptional regulator YafY
MAASLDEQGRYVLEIPFVAVNELLMDILRHGHEVEVLEPQSLRDAVKNAAKQLAAVYR